MTFDSKTIENSVFELLNARDAEKSICPSEVARVLSPEDWRPLMPAIRDVGFKLMEEGRLRVTQHGETVDPSNYKGPIRFMRPLQVLKKEET